MRKQVCQFNATNMWTNEGKSTGKAREATRINRRAYPLHYSRPKANLYKQAVVHNLYTPFSLVSALVFHTYQTMMTVVRDGLSAVSTEPITTTTR